MDSKRSSLKRDFRKGRIAIKLFAKKFGNKNRRNAEDAVKENAKKQKSVRGEKRISIRSNNFDVSPLNDNHNLPGKIYNHHSDNGGDEFIQLRKSGSDNIPNETKSDDKSIANEERERERYMDLKDDFESGSDNTPNETKSDDKPIADEERERERERERYMDLEDDFYIPLSPGSAVRSPLKEKNECKEAVRSPLKEKDKFMENAWKKEVDKNVISLFKAHDRLSKRFKEVEQMAKKRRDPSTSSASSCDEEVEFNLLPNFKLKKVKYVMEMETNINEDVKYKKQLIKKLSTFGGEDVKTIVINIFNGIFTNKLKAKMCWKGTPKKAEFRAFTGLRDVLRQAAKKKIKKCTLADIDKECKLRFNQAQKDYDREKEKMRRLNANENLHEM